jgi:hypothetical protein
VPNPTARLGFTVADLGAFHVGDPGTRISYDYCPPASGRHYNVAGQAPMPPAAYQPAQDRAPGYWIHNLEHGFTVLLYRCPSGQLGVGECITRDEMAQLEAWYDQVPAPQVSNCPKKVMVARFDQMSSDFALVAWDRVLLMDQFDLDTALLFDQQWTEHEAVPERGSC